MTEADELAEGLLTTGMWKELSAADRAAAATAVRNGEYPFNAAEVPVLYDADGEVVHHLRLDVEQAPCARVGCVVLGHIAAIFRRHRAVAITRLGGCGWRACPRRYSRTGENE